MELRPEIQEGILTLLCHHEESAPLIESLIPPDSFDPFYKQIAEAALQHRAKHGQCAGEHTYDLVKSLCARDEDSADSFEAIFHSMEDLKEGIQPKFIIEQARVFSRWQTLRRSWIQQGKALDRRDLEGIESAETLIRDSLKPMADLFSPGISLDSVDDVQKILIANEVAIIPTGIEELDNAKAGPARGRLHCLMASTGRGKSWYLTHLAKVAAKRNFKVLYLTLEMDETEVTQRIYQAMFSVSESESVQLVHKIRKESDGGYGGITSIDLSPARPTLRDENAHVRLVSNLQKASKAMSSIRVKAFPQNQLTVQKVEGFLDGVGMHSGFSPDLVLIDYADLFHKNPNDIRGSLRLIYEDLKALAQKRNIAIATVTQSNRSGVSSQIITEEQVGEDFSKMQTADSVVTYSQTQEEHSIGFARLFVAKNRGGRGRQMIAITQSYALGQFCLSSSSYLDGMDEDVMSASSRLERRGTPEDPDVLVETVQ